VPLTADVIPIEEKKPTMSAVHLLVLIEVKPGKRQQQLQAYQKLKPLVLSEAGCLRSVLLYELL
jgi:quinol monooxygenase YgiN